MDKGRQPTLWSNHNLDILANEAFRRGEEKRKIQVVSEILNQPDGYEESNINTMLGKDSLSRFGSMLDNSLNLRLSPDFRGNYPIRANLFKPHESIVDSSNVMPVEVSTSVVAFDIYKYTHFSEDGVRAGSVLLFKLSSNLIDEPAPDMTAKDLAWGDNCSYGAFVEDNSITYFKFARAGGDVVRAEVRRKDPTEESGQSVEMQVVEPGKARRAIQKLSSSSKEAIELDQEMEKFIASRREVVAPDEE